MTATGLRSHTYRLHELAFDSSDDGHVASCSCGWPRRRRLFFAESDAHYAGAEHLARMAYRRLALRGLVAIECPPEAAMWAALIEHRDQLGDEACAVVETVLEHWPERAHPRGGVGDLVG